MTTTISSVAELELAYKPDAAEAQQRLAAYWAGDILDRACVSIRTPKEGHRPPARSLVVAADFDFQRGIAEFEEWASCMFFGGESMPALQPNWGPDQLAAFVGAEMTLVPEMDTSWITPAVSDWNQAAPFTIDSRNRWWSGIIELTRLAARECVGKFIISAIDIHSNVDCLSALRGPSQLCMDLIDDPEGVQRAARSIDDLYRPVYDAIYEAGGMAERGTTSWSDIWSAGRTQTVQSDFAYMVSPEHFRRFILPSLEYEMSCLDHVVYHMDGVGQIPHLDDLLAIPNLHTVQWVPGAGQPTAPAWVDMLLKIQKAGKSVQVLVSVDEVKALYHQLAPEQTYYWVLDCPSEAEARDLIHWMAAHT